MRCGRKNSINVSQGLWFNKHGAMRFVSEANSRLRLQSSRNARRRRPCTSFWRSICGCMLRFYSTCCTATFRPAWLKALCRYFACYSIIVHFAVSGRLLRWLNKSCVMTFKEPAMDFIIHESRLTHMLRLAVQWHFAGTLCMMRFWGKHADLW